MPRRQKPSREKGYFPTRNKRTGQIEHRIRIAWFGKMTWFGPYKTKTAALNAIQDKKAEERKQKQAPGQVQPTTGQMEQLIDQYLLDLKGKREDYRGQERFAKFWKQRYGHRPPLSLQPSEVAAALAELHTQGRKASTVNHYGKFLRAFMNRKIKPKSWVLDFWADIEWYDAEQDKARRIPLTPDQEDRLYKQLRPLDRLFTRLDVVLGLRRAQFFTLRWEWLSWPAALFYLPKFKCHQARELPIPSEGMLYLRWLWEQQGQPEQGWVFPQALNPEKPINHANWYRRHFRKAVADAGLSALKVDFHTLRHTFATRGGQTAPTRILQDLLGHSDIRMTELYTRAHDPAKRAAMEQAAAMNPKCLVPTTIELLSSPAMTRRLKLNKVK